VARVTPRQKEIVDTLAAHGGNLNRAALTLGVTRSTVQNTIKRLGLSPDEFRKGPAQGPSGAFAETPEPQIAAGLELRAQTVQLNAEGGFRGRYDKTALARPEKPAFEVVPASYHVTKQTSRIDADGRVGLQYITVNPEAVRREAEIKAAIDSFCSGIKPADPIRPPGRSHLADLLSAYPYGDPHVGMLSWARETGENFDLKIAEAELCECQRQLVARAQATERAILCNLGDFFHAEDPNQRTPRSGAKLDVDGRMGKVGEVGLRIVTTLIDTALTKHRLVEWRSIPGNHDPTVTWWLQAVIRAHYRNEPRVIVRESSNPYQFDAFGDVLLGWAHGDGAKLERLPGIMAEDEPEAWGRTRFRYWNTGHVHHWSEKELGGVVISTHRTLAAGDAWHHHSGYRAGKALKVITYHKKYGLDGLGVVPIERVREALKGKS
jgi:hypothetical protein